MSKFTLNYKNLHENCISYEMEILKLWNNYMLIRIKCSLHEYCVPVLFIASVTYLNIWEHFLWNEVHIDQCLLDTGREIHLLAFWLYLDLRSFWLHKSEGQLTFSGFCLMNTWTGCGANRTWKERTFLGLFAQGRWLLPWTQNLRFLAEDMGRTVWRPGRWEVDHQNEDTRFEWTSRLADLLFHPSWATWGHSGTGKKYV